MRKLIFVSIGFLLQSCVPNMAPPKRILKSVKTGDAEIEWMASSSAYVDVPDLVILRKGKYFDTLCSSTNIADLKYLGNSNIIIGFLGKPKQNNHVINLRQSVLNYKIIVDTSYKFKAASVHK